MLEKAIRTTNLTRDFDTVRAVDSLSLDVPAGTIFGFLGPNGAGKTTTIRMLLGLLEPSSGQAQVLGFDSCTQADQVRAQTGALLESSGVYEQLSGEDNLEFYGRIYQMPRTEREQRIKQLLTHMGLWDRRKEQAGTWSRGMQQKLALARTLLHQPQLVLLDEPTAGLDVVAAAAIRDDLEALVEQQGVTVFLTTHNMAEAERLCDTVAVIKDGRMLDVGNPDELRARASGPRLDVRGGGFSQEVVERVQKHPGVASAAARNGHLSIDLEKDVDAASLVNLLVGAGAQVEEVRRSKASLEEVFLTLVEEQV